MPDLKYRYWIALGSNLGDRLVTLKSAALEVVKRAHAGDVRKSPIFETAPVGSDTPQQDYYNAVMTFESEKNPLELLRLLLEVERLFGRERSVPNAPRTLDLDILMCDHKIICLPDLYLPHPRMQGRAFVLGPLSKLDPDLLLGPGKTTLQAYRALPAQVVKELTLEW